MSLKTELPQEVVDYLDLDQYKVELLQGGQNHRTEWIHGQNQGILKSVPHNSPRLKLLKHEFFVLKQLKRCGIQNTPQPYLDGPNWILLEAIKGSHPLPHPDDYAELANFILDLQAHCQIKDFPKASEGCLQYAEIFEHLTQRRKRFSNSSFPELKNCLKEFDKHLNACLNFYQERSLSHQVQPMTLLSPSDCGFHNAIKTSKGWTFFDFEYFGQDHAAKLTSDVLIHPASTSSIEDRIPFARRLERAYPGLTQETLAFLPVQCFKWALLCLNEFLNTDLQRREFASGQNLSESDLDTQLSKSLNFLKLGQQWIQKDPKQLEDLI